jgi:hypothetical protein
VAVLTEPQARIRLHLDNLPKHRSDGVLFAAADLFRLENYPQAHLIGPFYAQSVSLVEYLSTLSGGPRTFMQFVQDGLDHGYEPALRKHYGIPSFADLEQRWQAHAFSGGATFRASAD